MGEKICYLKTKITGQWCITPLCKRAVSHLQGPVDHKSENVDRRPLKMRGRVRESHWPEVSPSVFSFGRPHTTDGENPGAVFYANPTLSALLSSFLSFTSKKAIPSCLNSTFTVIWNSSNSLLFLWQGGDLCLTFLSITMTRSPTAK